MPDQLLAYYDVVRQKQQLASLNEVISYNKERVKILQTSFNAGLIPKTDLLQAMIDLNVYSENAITQQMLIVAVKRNLNQLLSRDADIAYDVADTIPLNYVPDKEELTRKLYSGNTSILSFQKQVDIAHLSLREFKTYRLPRITFNAGYNYLLGDNTAGTVLRNTAYGPQIGGSIIIPIYQSGNVVRQINTAKLQLQSAQYDFENVKLQVNTELQNALTEFETQEQLLMIERDNARLTTENLEITMERLRLGQTTSLEVSQAQENFVDSQTRLVNFEYLLKTAETKLRQLIAEL